MKRYKKNRRKMFPGGLILGGIGLLTNVIGNIVANKRAKKEQALLAKQEEEAQKMNTYLSDLAQLQVYDNMYNQKASGGTLSEQLPFSLSSFLTAAQENGMSEILGSDMSKFVGPNHEQGGIGIDADLDGNFETEVEGGEVLSNERVFTKRYRPNKKFLSAIKEEYGIKLPQGTYASIAEELGKRKENYERKLEEATDEASLNTANIMLERLDEIIDLLFKEQEMSKVNNNGKRNKTFKKVQSTP